jgi:hypothetical protein
LKFKKNGCRTFKTIRNDQNVSPDENASSVFIQLEFADKDSPRIVAGCVGKMKCGLTLVSRFFAQDVPEKILYVFTVEET